MKKINANFHKELAEKMPKTKKIVVPVEDEEYEIEIKNYLNLEEKKNMLTDVMELAKVGVANQVENGAVLLLLGIYKAVSDIEFPELPEDQISQLDWLLETGIISAIQKEVKPGLIEELAKFLEVSFTAMAEAAQKRVAEAQKTPIKE